MGKGVSVKHVYRVRHDSRAHRSSCQRLRWHHEAWPIGRWLSSVQEPECGLSVSARGQPVASHSFTALHCPMGPL